jgi:spore maturation protein SpmA
MNIIVFIIVVAIAFLFAAWRQIFTVPIQGQDTTMALLSKAVIDSASGAVELAIDLVGVMTLLFRAAGYHYGSFQGLSYCA